MKNLRDSLWQLLAIILSLVAIFATYDVFFRSKENKDLKILQDFCVPLFEIRPEAGNEIQALYKGQPVNNLSLIQIQIENIGNQPILESDFSRNIAIVFSDVDKVIDAKIVSSRPQNLGAKVQIISGNRVEISPNLFNPSDKLILQFTVIGHSANEINLAIDGRIVGIKNLAIVYPTEELPTDQNLKTFLTILAGAIFSFLTGYLTEFLIKGFKRVASYAAAMGKGG